MGMQKLLSIIVYLILLIFLESAAEVTGVPASAPAELPEEPNYVALTFDDGPGGQRHLLLSGGAAGGERGSGTADAGRRASGGDPYVEPYPPGRYGPSGTAPGHSGSAKRSLQTPGHG